MWAMSYRFRKEKALEMGTSSTIDSNDPHKRAVQDLQGLGSEGVGPLYEEHGKAGEVGIAGLGVGRGWGQTGRAKMVARGSAVNSMLEGYYPIVRKAVATALAGRVGVVALLTFLAWRKLRAQL
jgi:peptidoglycan hydrolase-like amidase